MRGIVGPQEGPQTQFLASTADIVFYGGSAGCGKSYGLLLEPLRHINLKGFGATFFRRTYKQFTNQGGLWDESRQLYPRFNGIPKETDLTWKFPSGMSIQMSHLQYDSTVLDFHGSQIPLLLWDEITMFSEYQFFYMVSRNRSMTGVPGYIRGTCNPDPDSWVAELISWYLQEDGYPDIKKGGIVRWFIRPGDELVWGSSREELIEQYGSRGPVFPKSFTFIPGTIYDNPILLNQDPGYLANLHSLPSVERDRLLGGNWKVDYAGGGLFHRDWFAVVDHQNIPSGGVECRFWDFAATKVSKKNKDPDFTAGVKIRWVNGRFYVLDVIAEQLDPSEVDDLFYTTVAQDIQDAKDSNSQYLLRWETEPGSAGKRETYRLVSNLPGVDAAGVTSGDDKVSRAKPFAAQARIGNVSLRRASWNKAYRNHMHRQPNATHDDIMDASSGAEKALTVELNLIGPRDKGQKATHQRRLTSRSRGI